MGGKRISAAISVSGLGITVLLWVLSELKVHFPAVVLYSLAILALCLIAGPWLVAGTERLRRGKAAEESTRTAPDRRAKINVTSYSQSGGLTAHTVLRADREDESK